MFLVFALVQLSMAAGVLWLLVLLSPPCLVAAVGGPIVSVTLGFCTMAVLCQFGGSRWHPRRVYLRVRMIAFMFHGAWVGLWLGATGYLVASTTAVVTVVGLTLLELGLNRRAIETGRVPVMDDGTLVRLSGFNVRRWLLDAMITACVAGVSAWVTGSLLETRASTS